VQIDKQFGGSGILGVFQVEDFAKTEHAVRVEGGFRRLQENWRERVARRRLSEIFVRGVLLTPSVAFRQIALTRRKV
jgi:hypothetical protein